MFGKKESEQMTKNTVTEPAAAQNEAADGGGPAIQSTGSAAPNGGTAGSMPAKKKKKGKKKKRIIIVVAVLVVAAVAIKLFMGGGEPVMPTPTTTVGHMDVQQVISIKGTVEGNDRAEVTSAMDREIASISVKEGDIVTKGQLLATLEEKDKDKGQKYEIMQAQTNLESAKFDYETSQQLFEEGAISKQELIRAQTAYQNAQTALANAREDKTETDDDLIKSPISGIVTRVNAKVGFTASQMENGTALFVIEDLSSLKMEVRASEYDISNINIGQTVIISAEVLGDDMVEGVVSHIAPTGELKDGSGKEMVIPVKIDIKANDKNLIAGVTAKADILVAERKNAIAIPLDALGTDQATGENYVFTVSKDNILTKQVITTGLESDFYIEVTSDNLKEGDVIVLNPSPMLADGQTIVTEASAAGGQDAAPDDGAAAE